MLIQLCVANLHTEDTVTAHILLLHLIMYHLSQIGLLVVTRLNRRARDVADHTLDALIRTDVTLEVDNGVDEGVNVGLSVGLVQPLLIPVRNLAGN